MELGSAALSDIEASDAAVFQNISIIWHDFDHLHYNCWANIKFF
jgi:hypothetical protein